MKRNYTMLLVYYSFPLFLFLLAETRIKQVKRLRKLQQSRHLSLMQTVPINT